MSKISSIVENLRKKNLPETINKTTSSNTATTKNSYPSSSVKQTVDYLRDKNLNTDTNDIVLVTDTSKPDAKPVEMTRGEYEDLVAEEKRKFDSERKKAAEEFARLQKLAVQENRLHGEELLEKRQQEAEERIEANKENGITSTDNPLIGAAQVAIFNGDFDSAKAVIASGIGLYYTSDEADKIYQELASNPENTQADRISGLKKAFANAEAEIPVFQSKYEEIVANHATMEDETGYDKSAAEKRALSAVESKKKQAERYRNMYDRAYNDHYIKPYVEKAKEERDAKYALPISELETRIKETTEKQSALEKAEAEALKNWQAAVNTHMVADFSAYGDAATDVMSDTAKAADATDAAREAYEAAKKANQDNNAEIFYSSGLLSFASLSESDRTEMLRYIRNGGNKDAYNRIKGSMSADDFERMVETLKACENTVNGVQTDLENAKFAKEHPVTGSIASIFTSLVGGVTAVAGTVAHGIDNIGENEYYVKPIDTNSWAYAPTKFTTTVRGTVANDIEESVGGTGGKVASFLYQTGMSAADSLTASFAGDWGGALLLGSSAASSAFLDAKERGVSDSQAIWTGLTAGVFETLFERVSIGNLNALKETPVGTIKDIFKNLGKSTFVNTTEEGLTEAANMVSDYLINGDLSKYSTMYNELLSDMPESQAKDKVFWTMLADIGIASASGAFMGLGLSGPIGGINYVTNRNANTEVGSLYLNENDTLNVDAVNTLISDGLVSENDMLRSYAMQLQKMQEKGSQIDVKQLGALQRGLAAEQLADVKKAEKTAKKADKNDAKNAAQGNTVQQTQPQSAPINVMSNEAVAEVLGVDKSKQTSNSADNAIEHSSSVDNNASTNTDAQQEVSTNNTTTEKSLEKSGFVFTDELDELQNTEMPTVAVGDAFVDSKTGNTIRVVSRDADNTTIEIDTGKTVETKIYTNAQADTLAVSEQYEPVKVSAKFNAAETATDTSSNAIESSKPSVAIGEVYTDSKTGNTIRVVSRDDSHTVVEVSNGTSTWTNTFPNGFADTLKQPRYTQLTQATDADIIPEVKTNTDKIKTVRAKKSDWASDDVSWWAPNSKTVIAYSTVATSDLIETIAESNPKMTIAEVYNSIRFDAEAKKVLQAYINCGFGNDIASQHFVRNKNAIASVANESDVEYNEDTTQTENNEVNESGLAREHDLGREESVQADEKGRIYGRGNQEGNSGNQGDSEGTSREMRQSDGEKHDNSASQRRIVRGVFHGSKFKFSHFAKSYVDLALHFGTEKHAKARLADGEGNIVKYDLVLNNPLETEDIFGERTPEQYFDALLKQSKLTNSEKNMLSNGFNDYLETDIKAEATISLTEKVTNGGLHIKVETEKDGVYISLEIYDDAGTANEIPLTEFIGKNELMDMLGFDETAKLLSGKNISSEAAEFLNAEVFSRAIAFEQNYLKLRKIEDILKSLGYDGFKYENQNEGAGTSFAVFDDSQIIRIDGDLSKPNENASIEHDTVQGEVSLTNKCELIETKHTQTGKPLWVVSVKERLAKDEYSRLLDIVKKHGGYFSSAAKSLDGNKLSGFIFKEQPSGDTISAINEFFGEPESVNNESESSETSHLPALNNNYTFVKTKNTNTGDDTWLIKVKDRSQAYKLGELKEFIKDYDGRYAPALNSLILNKEPGADVINALNNLLSEDEPENVRSAETETTTTKEGNDNVHDGLLDRPSTDDDAGREPEPVQEVKEERNAGDENRKSSEDVARSGGELLQTTETESSASGQLDSGDNDNRVRESDDSEGHGAEGASVDDNVDVAEGGSKSKDFVITKAIAEDIDTSAPSMNDNIKAIETLHTIESSGKAPTKAQQGLLAKFKGWGGLAGSFYGANRSKLSELMSEDELKAAQGTVNDAYFTPTSIIDSIYKALSHLGFEGGNILEPSMGVGNFFGRMPKSVKDSSFLFGVEIDTISGRIARQLYPTANIEIAPFQDVAYKDGAFDLIVGNVPFGEVKYKYKGKKYLIHDYFFVKAMDKLSDGGILAFLTTKGTLDKLDSVARTELGKHGKLIAAYRLPSDVFSRSAGANVVTDLIIMQKAADKGGESFINLGNVSVGANEFSINEYFVNHPENIIGELVSKRDWRSGKEALDVKSTGNVAEQLLKAIKKLPRNMLSGAQTVGTVDVTESSTAMQTFAVTDSGDVEYVDVATGEVKQLKGKQATVAKEYIKLKNVYEDLINATLSENETSVVEGKRKDLNTVYDGFVKKNGTLGKNKKVLSADNDFYKISGLEVYDTKAKKIIKSEMFTKDTLGKRTPKKADNALDALSISIGESGGVNLNRIAELTSLSESEVIKQLDGRIVYTPEGVYELSEVYLSGNVREKYEAVKGKKGFEKNEEMLKAVIPTDIPAKNITPQFGAPWIKSDYVAEFLKETLRLYHKPTVNYDPTTGTWSISGSTWGDNTLLTSKYGTKYIDAISLAEKALNMRQIVIRDKDKRVLVGETRAAQQKAEDIKSAFEEWCFKDSDRRKDLVTTFNEKFNSNRNMDFSELAKYLAFDGLTDTFKLRDYQKRAVARAIFNGNTLLAHGVGTGKTAEMIAVAMELKRMGMAKKNMMVVPGHKVADFRNDILKMYPSAKVAMLEKGANATQRQKFYALVAANDFDIVIIPHSSFGMLDVSLDTKKAFINNQIAELEEVLTAAQEEKGKIDGRFIRQLENQKDRLEEKLKFVTETAKDSGNIFEELGVDSLFVDEAHNFKNLPFYSKLSRVAGVSINQPNNKTRASRAENMFMITDYLNRSGGRITFGTATPITNSMSEIYNMMRFLRPDILADAGLQSFDAWASMFGSIVNQAEVDPSGRNMRMKERFSKFKNVSQMIEQFRRMADILKTGDVIQELPKAERIDVINEPNDIQEEFLDIIDSMIDDIRANGQNADHNMLEVTTAGQMAAVDLRFVASYFDGKYSEDDLNLPGNRTTQVAQRVYDEYAKSTASKGTQFVFCDVGVSDDASKKYNFYVYGDLINKLVAHGIPRKEIAIAQEFEDKADLSAKVNTGEIRVLIGSTAVMGEGMNAQNKAVALHHMTVPARPSDIEQREGRIIRYGNENKNVRIYRYIQEKSYDSYQWQMQERKASFINQALSGGTVEELEEMSDFQLSAREAKAIASGNPLLLEKIELEDILSNLKSIRNKFNTDKLDMQDRLARLPSQIAQRERIIADTSADAKTVATNAPADFEITIGKTKYTERTKAADALKKILANAPRNGTRIKIGSYSGLDIYYTSSFDKGTHYILKGSGEYSVLAGESASGNITRIANLAEKIGATLETDKARVANYKAEIETLRNEVNAEFPRAKELEELQAKLNDIDTQLGINVSTVDMSEVIVDDGTDDSESANYSLESEGIDYERNALSDGSGGRNFGSRSGKQIAGLDKATGASENRSLEAKDRKAYTEKLTANQLEQRTERDSKGRMHRFFAIKRSAWNDNMRDVADYYEQRGLNVQFLKGNIQCAFVGSEYEARAMQKGDTLYVRYDHEYYYPEQLAEHEYIEHNYSSDDVQAAHTQILDNMTDAEYNKAIEMLKKHYKGVTDNVADLERELVCNILSGMYQGAAAYSDTVTEFWAKDKSISQGYSAASYSDMSDAGGNAVFVDAIGYGSESVVEEGGNIYERHDTRHFSGRVHEDFERVQNQRGRNTSDLDNMSDGNTTLEVQVGNRKDASERRSNQRRYSSPVDEHASRVSDEMLESGAGADERRYIEAVGNKDEKTARELLNKYAVKNGYSPIILYHGTHSDEVFTEFKGTGAAYWITDDLAYANEYSFGYWGTDVKAEQLYTEKESGIYELYIKLGNTLELGDINRKLTTPDQIFEFGKQIGFSSKEILACWTAGRVHESKAIWTMTATPEFANFARKYGYDTLLATERDGVRTFGVLYPENIKSAKTVTYDDKGVVIPLNERFDDTETDIRYSLDTYDKDAASLTSERKKEIFEQFDRDKSGPEKVSIKQMFGERAAWVAHNMTRVFPDIPERGEKGTFFAEFRKMMIQWKGLPTTASFMVQDKLNKMTEGLTPAEFKTFEKLVYFLDLQEEAQLQKEQGNEEILLPNAITTQEVDTIVNELDAEATEKVKQALVKRQSIWDELKEEYIALNQYIGFDTDNKFLSIIITKS